MFGGKTALEIVRASFEREIDLPSISLHPLPQRAPERYALTETLRVLNRLLPGFRPTFPLSILVGSGSRCRSTTQRVPSVSTYRYAGRQFFQLGKDAFALKPNAALCKRACDATRLVDVLLLLWEACGTYSTRSTGACASKRARPLTSVRSLSLFCRNNPRLPGGTRIATALRYVRDGSASMRETQLALMLGLPRMYGGFGLGLPVMNYRVEATGDARKVAGRSHFRCDLCWPEHRIDVEYQSDEEHAGEMMRVRDSRRANALQAMGWTVVGVTNNEIRSIVAVEVLAETLRRLMGRRSRPDTENQPRKRLALHRSLRIVDDGYRYSV